MAAHPRKPSTRGTSRFERSLALNIEKEKERAREALERFKCQPLKDTRAIAPKTKAERTRIWQAWTTYFERVHQIDPDSIWVDLCQGKDVSFYIRCFFVFYVEHSSYERPSLGLEEYEKVQGIKAAISIDGMWKTLLGKAEDGVLQQMRKRDPVNADKWTVQSSGARRRRGPVYMISKWIEEELPDELGLTRHQTFEKKEMTPEDILVVLGTLWNSARHIRCKPATRLAFHSAILVAGIGGFRPGEIMNLPYEQVLFELVRDPVDSFKRRLVATITIRHSKQQTKKIHRTQDKLLSFSITLVPNKTICLASILAARAIADEAFEAEFRSLEDMLTRPQLGGLNSVPLRWKSEKAKERIIPIHYPVYLEVWHRCILVAGLRDDKQRPYSMRVGAGGRLNGSLEPAVRGYVLGNSDKVFSQSYQPRHVGEDLVRIAFGEKATQSTDALFETLRNSFLRRDPDAPIYPSPDDIDGFEEREDIQGLRAEYRDVVARVTASDPEAKRIAAKIHWIRQSLSAQRVKQVRSDYFSQNDRLRASGLHEGGGRDVAETPFKSFDPQGTSAAERIGQFLSVVDEDHEQGSIQLVQVYIPFLQRRLAEAMAYLDSAGAKAADSRDVPQILQDDKGKPHRCLFGCGSFGSRGNLTRHNATAHFANGVFEKPFSCPECRRLGNDESMIDGAIHWSNHAETYHGRAHAPNLPPDLMSRPDASYVRNRDQQNLPRDHGSCLICGGLFNSGGAFARHFKQLHLKNEKLCEPPFQCPVCKRHGMQSKSVQDEADWQAHLVEAHDGGGRFGPLHSLSLEPRRRRKQKRSVATCAENDQEKASDNKRQRFDTNTSAGLQVSMEEIQGSWSLNGTNVEHGIAIPGLAPPVYGQTLQCIDPRILQKCKPRRPLPTGRGEIYKE